MGVELGNVEGGLKLRLSEWSRNIDRAVADLAKTGDAIDSELVAQSKLASASLGELARQVAQTAATLGGMESHLSDVRQLMSAVDDSAHRLTGQLGDVRLLMTGVDESAALMAKEMRGARLDAQQLGRDTVRAMSEMAAGMTGSLNRTRDLERELERTRAEIARVRQEQEKSDASGGRFGAGLKAVLGTAGLVSPRLAQLVSGYAAVEGAASAAGISLGVAAGAVAAVAIPLAAAKLAFNFTVEGIQLASDMEQVSIAMELLIGSADGAKKAMAELKTFADVTPFRFDEVSRSAKLLLAMGVDAKDLMSSLRMLGDVSSGLSQPLQEVAYLYAQVNNKAHADSVDLKQFAERGIPIYKALAESLHVNKDAISDMATAGKIGFAEISDAFRVMTQEGGQFHDMLKRQSESLAGKISTLADAWEGVKRAAGEAFNTREGKRAIDDLQIAITDLKPAIVDAAVAVAEVAKTVLPFLRETLHTLTAISDSTGASNRFKGNTSAAPDQRDALRALTADKAGAARMQKIAEGYTNAYFAGIDALDVTFKNKAGLTDPLQKRVADQYQAVTSGVDAIGDSLGRIKRLSLDAAEGKPISGEAWADAIKSLRAFMNATDDLTRTVRDARTEASVGGDARTTREVSISNIDQAVFGRINQGYGQAQEVLNGLQRQVEAFDRARQSAIDAANTAREKSASRPASNSTVAVGTLPRTPSSLPGEVDAVLPASDVAEDLSPRASKAAVKAAAKKEVASAARAEKDKKSSLERAVEARNEADIASMRAKGKQLEADLAEAIEKSRRVFIKAPTADEKKAEYSRLQAELDVIRKKSADDAAKKKKAADDKAAAEAKRTADRLKESVERTTDYATQAQLTLLRAAGNEYEAQLIEIEGRFHDRMRKALNQAERDAAGALFSAEKAVAAKDKHDADVKSGKVPVNAVSAANDRIANAKNSGERTLAQIDLREAQGRTLSPNEIAQRDRLRQRLGVADADGKVDPVAAARERVKNASNSSERSLAQIDLREAQGQRLSPQEEARRRRLRDILGVGDPSRTAGAATTGVRPSVDPSSTASGAVAAARPGAGSTAGSAGGYPSVNIAAPAIDEVKLGRAIAQILDPVIDQKIARAQAAARYAAAASGGVR